MAARRSSARNAYWRRRVVTVNHCSGSPVSGSMLRLESWRVRVALSSTAMRETTTGPNRVSSTSAIRVARVSRSVVSFLTSTEIDALLAAPDRTTRLGRRDHALLLLACQTGLRVSELIALTRGDIHLDQHGAHVRCDGKGRKERATPLTRQTVAALRVWLAEHHGGPADPVFTTGAGRRLSRDAVAKLVRKHAASAAPTCPGIAAKNVSPHTLRHSAAMALLHAGVDTSVIALWLGHEDPSSTQAYLHADMSIKENALARIQPPTSRPGRYRAPDALLAFLDNL